MNSHPLPDTRQAIVHKFSVAGTEGYLRLGLYEDGRIGEVFINMAKSQDAGPWGVIALLISMALQRGISLEEITSKLQAIHFEPSGITSNQEIPFASSIPDYIAKYLRSVTLNSK